jgi:hypothetical protein
MAKPARLERKGRVNPRQRTRVIFVVGQPPRPMGAIVSL